MPVSYVSAQLVIIDMFYLNICNIKLISVFPPETRTDNSVKKADTCFRPPKSPVRPPNGSDGEVPSLVISLLIL